MKHRQPNGFSLLELLVVTVIAAVLASLLFGAFWQTQQLQQTIDDLTTTQITVNRFAHQLAKDIAGIFIPEANILAISMGKPPEDRGEQSKKQKRIKKVFVGTQKDKMLGMLTFLTDNVFSVYNTSKPLVARVVYRLESLPGTPTTYQITRQEYPTLDAEALENSKKPYAYVLADGIKSCVIRYRYQERHAKETAQEKKESEQKTEVVWDSDAHMADNDSRMPTLPLLLELEIVLIDISTQTEHTERILIPIMSAVDNNLRMQAPLKKSVAPMSAAAASTKQSANTMPSGPLISLQKKVV